MPVVRSRVLLFLLFTAVVAGACHEDGDIQISSLKFAGVEHVDADALAGVLQTQRGSRLPWGRKRFFDRRAFEADLKRIEAFYDDRGFPDARSRLRCEAQ
jgi:outer membrane protein assembly factor BamA